MQLPPVFVESDNNIVKSFEVKRLLNKQMVQKKLSSHIISYMITKLRLKIKLLI